MNKAPKIQVEKKSKFLIQKTFKYFLSLNKHTLSNKNKLFLKAGNQWIMQPVL